MIRRSLTSEYGFMQEDVGVHESAVFMEGEPLILQRRAAVLKEENIRRSHNSSTVERKQVHTHRYMSRE